MRSGAIRIVLLVVTSTVVGATFSRVQAAGPAANGPSVSVTNDAAHPVPVTSTDDTARHAFAFFKSDSFLSSEDSHSVSFIVAAGKRLVIQSVSVNALLDTGTGQKLVLTAVQATVNSQLEDYLMAPTFTGTSASFRDVYTVSQPTTIYADGGTEVRVFATRNVSGSGGIMNASIQGYLIDCSVASCN